MADPYSNYADGWHVPYKNAFAITPSDTVALAEVTRAIYVGVAGDITMQLQGDSAAVLFKAVPVGTVLPVRATLVKATGTAAGNLLGLY